MRDVVTLELQGKKVAVAAVQQSPACRGLKDCPPGLASFRCRASRARAEAYQNITPYNISSFFFQYPKLRFNIQNQYIKMKIEGRTFIISGGFVLRFTWLSITDISLEHLVWVEHVSKTSAVEEGMLLFLI